MRDRIALSLVLGLLAAGCGGRQGRSADASASAGRPAEEPDHNACHLLSHQEVADLVERPVTMRDQTEATDRYSICEYSDSTGQFLFGLTAYWSGGREEWKTWQMASGLAQGLFERQEGINPDSIVRQGPVSGLGDGAYFSELLPSLVLKGDVLVELKLNFVPHAETKFRPLAERLLSRI